MRYRRMPIEEESPEQLGYGRIRHNLAESSVADAALGDLSADLGWLVLQYGDHLGLPALRELVAADGAGVTPDDVLVTPGAVAALFIIHTTLLEAGSHAIVARPNYATNVETPRTVGADVEYLDLAFEDGWVVDPDRIAAMLRPETRLVSLTTPHNPTGATLSRETLDAVIGLVERHGGARLLVDETYREMTFGDALPVAASLSDRVISVSSLSKTYGLPGIRVGWLVTRDPDLFGRFLAAKEQILISGSLVDETIAVRALERRPTWLPEIRERIAAAFSVTASWASRGSGARLLPAWTWTGSTTCCSSATGRSSGPATGSSSHGRTSGWATAGRRPISFAAGSGRSTRPSTRPWREPRETLRRTARRRR